MRRSIATILAATIFFAVLPQAAFSQSDSGEIAITVVDATTKAPIGSRAFYSMAPSLFRNRRAARAKFISPTYRTESIARGS